MRWRTDKTGALRDCLTVLPRAVFRCGAGRR